MADKTDADALIADQIAYYRARAGEYDENLRQLERYVSLGGTVAGRPDDEDRKEVAILLNALDGMRPFDTVLELACGTGWWTQWLAHHARQVTAVDAAEEMLALNRERVKAANVRYVRADIFSWRPDRQYDLVFFAFWMSHIPHDRFAAFWQLVRDSLAVNGQVFFIDELKRSWGLETRVDDDAVLRQLEDGRQFRAVKVFYEPSELETKLRTLGWNVEVRRAGRRFYWGQQDV
ncbi:MAG TPA: class I SAM-dependent methyltransferase [Candidatus Dormibacteraeota bacterium]|nr:class I SAM-dependent methyltransferase [Candidatus Dormibacteraeota bacterium]